jgi:drug/metabolite transporter (DMT)-like permease
VIAAFAAIYVFWGSTFLGIRFAIETIPPFFMAGTRFLLAGVLLYVVARLRTRERPTILQWRDAAVVGCLLLAVANGSVTYVEQKLPTIVAALIISLSPVSMVLIEWLRGGPRPGLRTQVGLAFGILGVALIAAPSRGEPFAAGQLSGVLILLSATLCWAYGSVWSRHANKPSSPLLLVGMQMTAAGVALLMVGVLCGEGVSLDPASFSRKSMLAWLYLFTAGSLIGFTAYIWLLQVTSTARVATHSYVNPLIAVGLGVSLGKESLSSHAALGAALIVMAVLLILWAPRRTLSPARLQRRLTQSSPGPAAQALEQS